MGYVGASGTRKYFKEAGKGRHPSVAQLLKQFAWEHLPHHLQEVSRPLGETALHMVDILSDGPELSTGLRKLLEAKDCLVRARLDEMDEQEN